MSYTSSHNPLFAKKKTREREREREKANSENINENALATIWARASPQMKLVDNQIGLFPACPSSHNKAKTELELRL